MKTRALSAVLALTLCAGCVTSGAFHEKESELARSQQALGDQQKKSEACAAQLKQAQDQLAQLNAQRDELGRKLQAISGEKGQLSENNSQLQKQLDDLARQKAAADARAATYRNLMSQLRSMIDAGKLKVQIREGRMLINLPTDVLFDPGKTNLKPAGQSALAEVAQVLSGLADRKFQVAGNTDDIPIHSARFPSNWELSTARAVTVTRFLIAQGMKPQQLAAAGYGEFDPVAPNGTPEHRAANRRIEIALQPNLAELPSMDELTPADGGAAGSPAAPAQPGSDAPSRPSPQPPPR